MKKVVLFFALAVGLLASASTMQAQVNMSSYITLTVKKDSAIKLDFKAAADGTPVRIVSGSNTQNITVGTSWYNGYAPSTFTVTAAASTMTIYGDITVFYCSENGVNLTAIDLSHNTQLTVLNCGNNSLNSLDISHNTQLTVLNCGNNSLNSLDISQNTKLTRLYCHGNNFSTQALDDIFCALPDRTGNTNGKIQPIFNSSSPNHATVLATNAQNAITKNWKVQYYDDNTDIPATTGSYVCSGGGGKPNMDSYITLTVKNGEAIRLDLWATANITPIRIVSGSNTQDIIVNDAWKGNAYYTAGSTTMTIYGDLKKFDCADNRAKITALDISHSPELEVLLCQGNQLSSLDVSKNMQLRWLGCYDNNFSTQALDDIFCALPDRTSKNNGVIQPIRNSSSPDLATVLATNKQNAIAKNWKVQYYDGNVDITTTGSYTCPQLNMSRYITLTVKDGEAIKLDFRAAAKGTPVRIVSGSNTQDITVGTDWTGFANYTAGSTTMTIYGDITRFDCSGNYRNLTALDPSHNTQLTTLYCHGNNFSTQALDDIFCALPDRTGKGNGVIDPVLNSSDPNHATVLATNAQNATAKNWKVRYANNSADITTTGSYDCSTAVAEAAAEPALTLYPNPVADVLYLSATARTIRIYDMYGIEVAHATDTDRVEVSHLPAGIYTVKADGTVAKMVKR